MHFSGQLCSLYRTYLRQVGKLPHLYLRQFFQIRARQDVQAVLNAKLDTQRKQRIKLVYKRIRRVEKANKRDRKAFLHILELAYGRIGKLKWELLEATLIDPGSPVPAPIIPSLGQSRPPVYSPQLKALLSHPSSKRNKVFRAEDFSNPRTLPPRADAKSEEARIFGRFSKRREVNIRWHFYRDELKKVFPPLEVDMVENAINKQEGEILPRTLSMSDHGVLREAENLVGNIFSRPPFTRRELRTSGDIGLSRFATGKGHPSRWIRRRYRTLLAQLPHLTYCTGKDDSFMVTTSPFALLDPHRHTRQIPDADSVTMAWLETSSTGSSQGFKEGIQNP
ncbi:hypothetical protein M413DRAFT_61799 [Hebeloma cylindrosporum]|uniref:LYR motif-containing protein Cup1-like N-terminal domain-containing protein n=1 Tax=Hebeloma cylindrosporum TaxID=76867 RepID=A0A0C3CVF1_HEBCY|nr:hypothetical protein M413DRAFT_61799 [Hebeloma cylindrosporum h7]